MKNQKKVISGKKSRAAGIRFEARVGLDLEKKGWICAKWTKNVELEIHVHAPLEIETKKEKGGTTIKVKNKEELIGKLIKAKPKFVFNPQLKRRIPMGMSSGFPDFIAFKRNSNFKDIPMNEEPERFNVMGVESKMNGILTKEEKEKCYWLLENNVFSKILIASRGDKRGQIKYEEFK